MVSLSEAASLLGCNRRTLHKCLQDAGIVPVPCAQDRKRQELSEQDVERLRPFVATRLRRDALTGPSSDDLEALRRRVEHLEREVRLLRLTRTGTVPASSYSPSSQNATRSDSGAILTAQADWGMSDTAQAPSERPVAVYVASGTDSFRTHADALRWLARHGISERTPKSWPGWREVELTRRAVLDLALSLQDPHNWRITWRLHRCIDDPACVCRELLPEALS